MVSDTSMAYLETDIIISDFIMPCFIISDVFKNFSGFIKSICSPDDSNLILKSFPYFLRWSDCP